MIEQKTNEVIMKLKEIRKAKGYSCQKVFDLVEASGGYVSLATIKRVFAEGSEEKNFRYEDSIRPIAAALLGENAIEQEGQPMTDAALAANALRSVASLKDDIIAELQKENLHLQEETGKKDKHIAVLTDQLIRKDRLILSLAAGLIGLLALNCVVLVIDVLHADIGFVRDLAARPLAIFGILVVLALIVSTYLLARKIMKKSEKQPENEGVTPR